MNHRILRVVGMTCILLSLALLYPGLSKPVLTLSGELEKSALAEFGIDLLAGDDPGGQAREMLTMLSQFMGLDRVEGRVEAYRSTRSILGLSRELAEHGNLAVALMIVTFSVVIPVLKLLLQALALVLAGPWGQRLLAVNGALGKWSMADVFVMAMLVAFMAGRASNHVGELLIMDARLEEGFWYFSAYCLFAIAAGGILYRLSRDANANKAAVGGAPDHPGSASDTV